MSPHRPRPPHAATIIPTAPITSISPLTALSRPSFQSERSKSSDGMVDRRHAHVSQSKPGKTSPSLPHLAHDFKSTHDHQSYYHPQPPDRIDTPSPPPQPSNPITIPTRKPRSRPSTPLSGRPKDIFNPESAAFRALKARKYSSSSAGSQASDLSTSPSRRLEVEPVIMDSYRQQSQPAQFTSPLSPSRSKENRPRERQPRPRPTAPNLVLDDLPRFHPAKFHHADARSKAASQQNLNVTSAARSNRPTSDAQYRLLQYQKEVVAGLTRSALSPKSPRLAPQGSPGGFITPLALETSGDYLSAGSGLSPASANSAREFVEKLISKENVNRVHPDIAGLSPAVSPNISPAVSPAGGCR